MRLMTLNGQQLLVDKKVKNKDVKYFFYSTYDEKKKVGSLIYNKTWNVWVLKLVYGDKSSVQFVATNRDIGNMMVIDYFNEYIETLKTLEEYKEIYITVNSLIKKLHKIKDVAGNVPVYIKIDEETLIPIEEVLFNGNEIILY